MSGCWLAAIWPGGLILQGSEWTTLTNPVILKFTTTPAWSYLAQVRVTLSQRRLQKHKLTYLRTHFPGMPEASPLFTSSQSMSYSGPPYSRCCSATCFRCKSSTAPTPISSSTDTWSMENKEGQSGKKSHSVVLLTYYNPLQFFLQRGT